MFGMSDPRNVAHAKKVTQEKVHHPGSSSSGKAKKDRKKAAAQDDTAERVQLVLARRPEFKLHAIRESPDTLLTPMYDIHPHVVVSEGGVIVVALASVVIGWYARCRILARAPGHSDYAPWLLVGSAAVMLAERQETAAPALFWV